MRYCKPPGPVDALHERDLNNLKNMLAHRELAVAAAMDYCSEEQICPPPWLVAAAAELLRDLLKREKAQKRGRAAGHIARYRQAMWDIERWDAVLAIRRIRETIVNDERFMKAYPDDYRKRVEHHKKTRSWLRHGTYSCASMYLAGRDARAGADAIRASYRRVKRSYDGPATDTRYWFLEERFLLKLGFESLHDRKPGTKWTPLYNLTP